MLEVYSEPLRRRYYASRLSLAYLYVLVSLGVGIVVPFFLAYTNVPSFWLKTNTYREQPQVEYEYKVIGLLQGLDSHNEPIQIFYSSMSTVNYLFQSQLRVPTLRSIQIDKNRDGSPDRFQLQALIPVTKGEKILASSIVAFFNVKLRRRARIDMEAIAYSTSQSALPGRAVYVDGDYVLNQRWPLRAKGGYHQPYEMTPLLDPNAVDLSVYQALLPRLVASYRSRNVTMDFNDDYRVWSPELGSSDDPLSDTKFNMTLNLRIPIANVLYTPTATEVLKDAWIKYLSILIVVAFLLDRLCSFIFYYQLLPTTPVDDVPTPSFS